VTAFVDDDQEAQRGDSDGDEQGREHADRL